ncbi:hypothetical protein [Gordonia zhenghanii]|uniref:hypothetical protein n=1 Tax=Gordonia zhenghanii TaxID=2911516 RepID=UPI001F431570|nr:hypothetical protein [Gordonia zhenghanii]
MTADRTYSGFLYVHARDGKGRPAALTALVASGVGILGVLAATCVTVVGYICVGATILSIASQDRGEPVPTVACVLVTMLFAANGVIWLEDVVHERVMNRPRDLAGFSTSRRDALRRRTTRRGQQATTRASPGS